MVYCGNASWSEGRLGGRADRRLRILLAVLLAVLGAVCVLAPAPARADSVANTALILGDSVSPGVAPDGSGQSLEQYEATQDGFATTVVTGAQWDAMTAAQFAQYQVLVVGDATCPDYGQGSSAPSFAAAAANATTWEPVVMASGGNRVLIGTDPTYHYVYGGRAGDKLEGNGIAYAGATGGATGAYVDLSCAYSFSTQGTPVPLLDGLSTHGPGQFTVGGAPCAGDISIVAETGPTAGLHDADLSNWQCSVHEYFDDYPADYTPYALATDPTVPPTYSANDVDTGAEVSGSPYILVAGNGITVTSNITLTPATQSLLAGAGSTTTVTATVVSGGAAEPGVTVTFSVDSGPNAGATFTGTTGPTGQAAFTYPDAGGVGTDGISATFVDGVGATEKALATVTWTAPMIAINGTVTNASGAGVANICVYPYAAATGDRTADPAACTDASGDYTLPLAAAGSYDVVFYDASGAYVTQWYADAPYEGLATPVTVVDGAPSSGIDAVLATPTANPAATEITGTVTHDGVGLPNICVYPYDAATGNRTADPAACTDASGNYVLPLAAPGSYNVVFYDASGSYPTQWYADAPYEGLATPVNVAEGVASTAINANLASSAAITGTVTDTAGDGIPGICVYPYDAATGYRTADPAVCTDASGRYTLPVAAAGSYDVVFYDASGAYVTQWYAGAPYEGGATPVTVGPGGPTTGIDAVMSGAAAGSEITGTVTDAAGAGVPNICVYPFITATTGRTADPAACTDASGDYTLALSAPGSYNIVFYDPTHTYATQWFNDVPYEAAATPVMVVAGTPATGVNAVVAP
jgi:hypothetical protein